MKKNIIYIIGVVLMMTGCSFLDKNPDQRATINTKKKVQLLLVNAYTECNHFVIEECSSDNTEDNNAPDATGHYNNMAPFGDYYNEMFAWQPVTTSRTQDSPYYIWTKCYHAIAVANNALEAISKLEAQGIDMSAEKGEALLCRAYNHFVLANIFCKAYKDEKSSQSDLGIPYTTEPERNTHTTYHRETVTKTYAAIEKDLLEGLELVSDAYYTVPRYHFTPSTAYAFAARFYLYKREYDKVIYYADMVLGSNPSAKLFDANYAYNVNTYPDNEFYTWINGSASSNLLITAPVTYWFFSNFSSYGRYQFTRDAKDYTVSAAGPCWKNKFPGLKAWSYGSEYGVFVAKCWYLFEYKDKVAGTGLYRSVMRHFTTNELLLNRAEAKILSNRIDEGIEDLKYWAKSYDVNPSNPMSDLTGESIRNFYYKGKNNAFVPTLHTTEVSPGWTIPDNQMPYLWCCLHFRRIETIHEGLRWHDIKRFGIEITHKIGNNPTITKTLIADDDRTAIQLPPEVIMNGLPANPRTHVGDLTDVSEQSVQMPTDLELMKIINSTSNELKIAE